MRNQRAYPKGYTTMTHGRALRTTSAALGTFALAALLSLSASPAMATEPEWSAPVEAVDSYGNADATVVAVDGTITTVAEGLFGINAASSFDAGATWSSHVQLNDPLGPDEYAFRPAVTVTASGLLGAVWVEQRGGDVRSIHFASSDDRGLTWSEPVALPTVADYVDDPVIATTDGSFVVAWNEGFAKRASASTDGGATWTPSEVLTQDLNSYNRASLAQVGPNKIVVIFQEFDGDAARWSMQSRVSTDGGATWSDKEQIGDDWAGSLGGGVYNVVASPAEGTAVAVWGRGVDDGEALFAATSTDGGETWGPVFTVGSSASYLRYFDVEVISPTAVGVMWTTAGEDGITEFYSTVSVGGTSASTPVVIASSLEFSYDYRPAFAALGDVRVASWMYYDYEEEIVRMLASVSCDAGATWSEYVEFAGDYWEMDSQVVVSGTTFVAYANQEGTGPTERSLVTSSLVGACGLAPTPPAPGPALANTGSSIAPAALASLVVFALGAGLIVARRRTAAN